MIHNSHYPWPIVSLKNQRRVKILNKSHRSTIVNRPTAAFKRHQNDIRYNYPWDVSAFDVLGYLDSLTQKYHLQSLTHSSIIPSISLEFQPPSHSEEDLCNLEVLEEFEASNAGSRDLFCWGRTSLLMNDAVKNSWEKMVLP